MMMASGSASARYRRTCASACGCEASRATPAMPVPGRAIRAKRTGRATSSTMTRRLPLASSSRVTDTEPSTEFSMGMRAQSTSSARTASIAACTDIAGTCSASAEAGIDSSAASQNVPARPEVGDALRHDSSPLAMRTACCSSGDRVMSLSPAARPLR